MILNIWGKKPQTAKHSHLCTTELLPGHECQPLLCSAVVDDQLGATYEEIHSVGEKLEALLLLAAVHRRDDDSFHPG